jgi:DNA-binding response OmpR family regulator
MRVLVAGDSPTTRPPVQSIVEGLGHECVSAAYGAEAWDQCATGIVDVVIGDWRAPGFDGLELCHRVRAHPTVRDTYFIMLLAPGDRRHARQAMEAGANDFLVEPLDAEELQLRLVAAARVTDLQRQLADLQRTRGRFQGVTLASRELAHRLNNDLALALGTLELVRARVPMPETFQTLVDDAVDRLELAGRHVADLQQVVQAATEDRPVSPSLDLPCPVERSLAR